MMMFGRKIGSIWWEVTDERHQLLLASLEAGLKYWYQTGETQDGDPLYNAAPVTPPLPSRTTN